MNNVRYSKTLISAHDSPDGEATILYVTKEVNCFLLCIEDFDGFRVLEASRFDANRLIEKAVAYKLAGAPAPAQGGQP